MHAPTIGSASAALLCGLFYSASTLRTASATCPIRPASLSIDYGFGSTVVLPGDLNGDGADDFVIGAAPLSQSTSVPGRVHIYFGGPLLNETSDVVLDGQAPTDLFGYAVAGAGDLNGDGHVDLVVGAFHHDAGGSNCGRANVYFGGPGRALLGYGPFTAVATIPRHPGTVTHRFLDGPLTPNRGVPARGPRLLR